MDYTGYLRLPQLLSAQARESEAQGQPAHDEMLFIVVHQVYELWFKQILWEIALLQRSFNTDELPEKDIGLVVQTLARILAIQKHLVAQIDILETMTPMDFLEFRDWLRPASGFQSEQFRQIEIGLGLPRQTRAKYDNRDFDEGLTDQGRAAVADAQRDLSVLDGVDRWLARMPFLSSDGFSFRGAIATTFAQDRKMVQALAGLSEAERKTKLNAIAEQERILDSILDDAAYERQKAQGLWRMSRKGLEATLFIALYRDEPVLQQPYRVLSLLMDIDEAMTQWRHRHMMMVARMIGARVGTGGSSGADYLRRTVDEHRVFADLFAISTFLIPRSRRPVLPPAMLHAMRFRYDRGA
jgi:tryptophan 2,3-dioxygenase